MNIDTYMAYLAATFVTILVVFSAVLVIALGIHTYKITKK